ncbi:hypothetical protein CpipJ_CPIJ016379 [Culex quinquefasciatus]|uniref:Uncharacterized protein n=1 Tax=Culex quinquefasciatus TaxID=7176 RepID=B0XA38_CULQU|nr:hypothetical protein CpipJ_CPIJ016379 [Culex quinquefasciatus]|eukprot:XP_001866510.1 hypothetical protein CpipJ_CPIJ016379 [Culex quinquefasciatus]
MLQSGLDSIIMMQPIAASQSDLLAVRLDWGLCYWWLLAGPAGLRLLLELELDWSGAGWN